MSGFGNMRSRDATRPVKAALGEGKGLGEGERERAEKRQAACEDTKSDGVSAFGSDHHCSKKMYFF